MGKVERHADVRLSYGGATFRATVVNSKGEVEWLGPVRPSPERARRDGEDYLKEKPCDSPK